MYILCSDASLKLSFSSSLTAYKYGRLHQNRYWLCVQNVNLLVVWYLCILYGKPHKVVNGNAYFKYRENSTRNTTKYWNEKRQKLRIEQLKMMSYYKMKMTSIAFYMAETIPIIETFLFLNNCNYQCMK